MKTANYDVESLGENSSPVATVGEVKIMAIRIYTPEEVATEFSLPEDKRVHAMTLVRSVNLDALLAEGVKVGSAIEIAEGDETHEKDGAQVSYPLSTILAAYKSLVKSRKQTEQLAVKKVLRKADGKTVVQVKRTK